jgi:hypothetical protein
MEILAYSSTRNEHWLGCVEPLPVLLQYDRGTQAGLHLPALSHALHPTFSIHSNNGLRNADQVHRCGQPHRPCAGVQTIAAT